MGGARGIAVPSVFNTRCLADPDKLRTLPALPETRRELEQLAAALGAGPESLHMGPDATEAKVKAGMLADAA